MDVEQVEDFPVWAITFAMYNDMDGLEDDEINEVIHWMASNGYSELIDVEEGEHFCPHPAFGKACNVVTATFALK